MQINKLIHPRLDADYLDRRRKLYQDKDEKGYQNLVELAFLKNIKVAQSGYKALGQVLGLNQGHVQKSMFTYSIDLDHRDVMEEFFKKTVTPHASLFIHPNAPDSLNKEQVLKAV